MHSKLKSGQRVQCFLDRAVGASLVLPGLNAFHALTSLCRRRVGQFWSAAALRRSQTSGQKFFSKASEKISFYPKNFLMTFFSHRSKIARK